MYQYINYLQQHKLISFILNFTNKNCIFLVETPISDTIDLVIFEQYVSDSRANGDFMNSCLSNEKQDKLSSVVPKGI